MNDVLLLGLPNTGTDWLVGNFTRHNPQLKYFREFFNPVTNLKYQDVLGRAFGSEMVSNHRNITAPNLPLEEVFQATWKREQYNFTKENYSPFRVKFFSEKFKCFALVRKTELVFPPSRWEVVAWYDAIYNALVYNKEHLESGIANLVSFAEERADTTNKKIAAACEICSRKLMADARALNIPILDYDYLMVGDDLERYLTGLPGVSDPKLLADLIYKSRVPKRTTFENTGAGDFLRELKALSQPKL